MAPLANRQSCEPEKRQCVWGEKRCHFPETEPTLALLVQTQLSDYEHMTPAERSHL